jgi:hypothetical protein
MMQYAELGCTALHLTQNAKLTLWIKTNRPFGPTACGIQPRA